MRIWSLGRDRHNPILNHLPHLAGSGRTGSLDLLIKNTLLVKQHEGVDGARSEV